MTDTHCHIIDKFKFTDPQSVINRAKLAGVNQMICIACDLDEVSQLIPLLKKNPEVVYGAIALHPEVVKKDSNIDEIWRDIKSHILDNRDLIFAIGECGLDYYRAKDEEVRIKQRDLFKRHIQLSFDLDFPLIIHTRDAWEDTFKILDEMNVIDRKTTHHIISEETEQDKFPNMTVDITCGIIHSFTGGIEEAKKCIERGFKLGINGIVTFKGTNSDPIREAVKYVGLENIVLETDSPFLTPEPYRGQINEPAHIKEIAEFIDKLFQ